MKGAIPIPPPQKFPVHNDSILFSEIAIDLMSFLKVTTIK